MKHWPKNGKQRLNLKKAMITAGYNFQGGISPSWQTVYSGTYPFTQEYLEHLQHQMSSRSNFQLKNN